DPAVYMRNMAELVRLSNVKAVLTTDEFVPQLAQVADCAVYGSITPSRLPAVERVDANGDDIAFLQHSSGTTGLQKGVALSHAAVLRQLASYSAAIGLSGQDVIVSWLPLY